MHALLDELHQYHRKKSHYLYELEKCIDNSVEGVAHAEFVQSVQLLFEPFRTGSEEAHHHNEELILGEIRKTSAPVHRRVEEISGDHRAFSRIIDEISKKIDDRSTTHAEISTAIKNFVAHYNDHAEAEETIFFPIAEQYLQPAHWEKIEKAWK